MKTRSDQILELILEQSSSPFRNPDQYPDYWGHHLEKIRQAVLENTPIHFVLPAYPAKSPNPQKTCGNGPDFGEVLSLVRLNRLCRKIEAIYPPGARLTICSDGRVFGDLVRVSDPQINEYSKGIRSILQEYNLDHLDLYNLEDVFMDHPDFSFMREKLSAIYAEPLSTIRERVKSDENFNQFFNGIHRFLFEDHLILDSHLSKNQIRNQSKELAYHLIQRSDAWSRLIEKEFPAAVRLSIHPQPPRSKKIGIRLLPSNDIWRTPWHAVPLFDGQQWVLARRQDVEQNGSLYQQKNGKYAYYIANSEPGQNYESAHSARAFV